MQKIWLWCITIFLWENELEIQIVRPSTHLFPAIPSVVAFGVFSSFLLLTFHMVGARFLTQLTVTGCGLGGLKWGMETLRWQARSSQVFGVGSFWVFFVIEKSLDLRYLVSGWHSHQTFLFLPFQESIYFSFCCYRQLLSVTTSCNVHISVFKFSAANTKEKERRIGFFLLCQYLHPNPFPTHIFLSLACGKCRVMKVTLGKQKCWNKIVWILLEEIT